MSPQTAKPGAGPGLGNNQSVCNGISCGGSLPINVSLGELCAAAGGLSLSTVRTALADLVGNRVINKVEAQSAAHVIIFTPPDWVVEGGPNLGGGFAPPPLVFNTFPPAGDPNSAAGTAAQNEPSLVSSKSS